MDRLELFLFSYRDPRTGKWIRGRYRAERHEIAARYAEFEVIREPEIREIDRDLQRFSPHGDAGQPPGPAPQRPAPDRDSSWSLPPLVASRSLRGLERSLLLLFLRRYVTYCARRRKFAAMNGAARLHAAILAASG